jgi:hypothetical protein
VSDFELDRKKLTLHMGFTSTAITCIKVLNAENKFAHGLQFKNFAHGLDDGAGNNFAHGLQFIN